MALLTGIAGGAALVVLAVLGAPVYLLVAVGIAITATEALVLDQHPLIITGSIIAYILAVAIGAIGFTLVGLTLSGL